VKAFPFPHWQAGLEKLWGSRGNDAKFGYKDSNDSMSNSSKIHILLEHDKLLPTAQAPAVIMKIILRQ